MNGRCSACGAPVVWRCNLAGKPEPFDPDTQLSHFGSCPHAHLYRPAEPSEPYEVPGEAERNVWDDLSREEVLTLQLEASRAAIRDSGVGPCRERQRDPEHGDKWCRMCYQPRPVGYRCDAGRFGELRYARVDGEVKALSGDDLKKYLRQHKGAFSEQALV